GPSFPAPPVAAAKQTHCSFPLLRRPAARPIHNSTRPSIAPYPVPIHQSTLSYASVRAQPTCESLTVPTKMVLSPPATNSQREEQTRKRPRPPLRSNNLRCPGLTEV